MKPQTPTAVKARIRALLKERRNGKSFPSFAEEVGMKYSTLKLLVTGYSGKYPDDYPLGVRPLAALTTWDPAGEALVIEYLKAFGQQQKKQKVS